MLSFNLANSTKTCKFADLCVGDTFLLPGDFDDLFMKSLNADGEPRTTNLITGDVSTDENWCDDYYNILSSTQVIPVQCKPIECIII